MLKGIKHQLKAKTLLFIIIFSIVIFVSPKLVFAWEQHNWLEWGTITWRYKTGHLYLDFTSDVTTDELEVYFFNVFFDWNEETSSGHNMEGWIEKDISVLEGISYSRPIIYLRCDSGGSPVENAEGVTPVQVLSLPCISVPIDEGDIIDSGTGLKIYVGAEYEYGPVGPDIHFTETANPPTLEATFPVTGTTTEFAFGSFIARGSYSYDIADWSFLEVQLSTSTTSTIYKFQTDIQGADSGTYSIAVDLPHSGTYDLKYFFYGYVYKFEGYMPFSWEDYLIYEVPIATTTIVVEEGVSQAWWNFLQAETYEEAEPEEGTIQHYLWSIKQFFKGIYLPSKEAKINFLNTILKVRDRFPYNYIDEIKDFFTTTSENIEQDPDIEFALLGVEGTAHTSFFDVDTTIGDETKPLFEWFKTISKLILWSGLLLYIISFIKRIF